MKKAGKACLSFLLIVAIVFPVLGLSASAAERTPVINIEGEKNIVVWREDGTYYVPTEEPADAVLNDAISELAPLFAKAYVTNNYTEWSRVALEKLTPIYDEIRPAPDGTLPENTGPDIGTPTPYYLQEIPDAASVNYYYTYAWDYRMSPLDAADELHAFVQKVKEKTGAEKVTLSSRCGSTSIAAAYLYKFGIEDLEKMIFSASTLLGTPYVDAVLGDSICIPGSALFYFMQTSPSVPSMDARILNFINAMLYSLNLNNSADDMAKLVLTIYDKIKDSFVAPFLRSYYAIGGNFIGFVGEHYEDYKNFIFPTEELRQEYAAILAKADEYHYNVQEKLGELFSDAMEEGVPVYFIAFYGEPNGFPVSERSSLVGDELVDANFQSLGATVPVYPEKLSDDYIAERTAAGFGDYISPDGQIDASTCMFPETTFFIKNMHHLFFADDLHNFIRMLAWTDGVTIKSDAAYPQFLTAVESHTVLLPAQAENDTDTDPASYEPKVSGIMRLFTRLIAFYAKIVTFFARLFGMIG